MCHQPGGRPAELVAGRDDVPHLDARHDVRVAEVTDADDAGAHPLPERCRLRVRFASRTRPPSTANTGCEPAASFTGMSIAWW